MNSKELITSILGPVDKYRGGRYEEIRDAFVRLIEHFSKAAPPETAELAPKNQLGAQPVEPSAAGKVEDLLTKIHNVAGWKPIEQPSRDDLIQQVKSLIEWAKKGGDVDPIVAALAIAEYALMAELHKDDTANEIAEYKRQIARLEKRIGGLQDSVRLTEEDNKRLADINKLHRDKAAGDYWAWQMDGDPKKLDSLNNIDSLTCPILIRPEDLKKLISPQPPKEKA